MAETICGHWSSCNFKIAFICRDVLTLTFDHLTFMVYQCVVLCHSVCLLANNHLEVVQNSRNNASQKLFRDIT